MPWNSPSGNENIFGTVLAIFMVLDAYTAGDRTMEGNLLGSQGTGNPDSIMGLSALGYEMESHKHPTGKNKPPYLGKSGENSKVSSTRLGFFRGGIRRIQS